MARSTLQALINGTRQLLSVQLVIAVVAIALAAWTLGVTTALLRERDRLQERVIQLEQAMSESGVVVPEAPALVEAPPPTASAYPGEIGELAEASSLAAPESAEERRGIGTVIGSLFAPAPEMRLLVLHVRGQNDAAAAQPIAEELEQNSNVRVVVDVLAPRDQRPSGYAYFDGRQSRAALALVTQFHDVARRSQLAPWASQLRGRALPAEGEYTADRLDLVLPPLPEPAPAPLALPPG
jgi:hypothetical protein